MFRGLGNGRFEDVSESAGAVLSERTVARGACFADYDNDGKVDAFLVNLGAKGTLVHNVSTNTGHWVAIKLGGRRAIATALARVLRCMRATGVGRGASGGFGLSLAG